MKMKTTAISVALVLSSMAGAAHALPLNGTFNIDVYTFDAGGVTANADATIANLTGKTLTANVTYTGDLKFETTGPNTTTVSQFLGTGGGGIILNSGSIAGQMTAGGFTTTTLFDITGTLARAISGTIFHDDGISLFDDGVDLMLGAEAPTEEEPTPYMLTAGTFRLIYSAANGNPEVLNFDVNAVPLPAPFLLLGSAVLGLAGFGAKRRRRAG